MKLFTPSIARLRILSAKWRSSFTSLRTVIPSGLGVIHLATLSDGNEDPPIRDAQLRPIGLMQIPQRIGTRLGFRPEDLAKPINNIYAWCKLTNQDARTLYNLNTTLWTQPLYDFWLTVHLMFLMQSSFNTLWANANLKTTDTDNVLVVLLAWINDMPKGSHVGHFDYRTMFAIARHITSAQRFLVLLDGPDHATSSFGAEMTVPNPGTTTAVLQTSAT